jgi:hypothetical protein
MSLITLKGVLVTPYVLSTSKGDYDVEKETFYELNKEYFFLLDQNVYPWRIIKAIKVR